VAEVKRKRALEAICGCGGGRFVEGTPTHLGDAAVDEAVAGGSDGAAKGKMALEASGSADVEGCEVCRSCPPLLG
jgi:hypothetical protein